MRELLALAALAAGAASAPVTAPSPASTPPHDRRATPPSLSAGALAAELRESQRRRLEELAELQRERARLEQLAAEIALARRELAREAALLEEKARDAEQLATATPPPANTPRKKDGVAVEGGSPKTVDEARVQTLARTVKGMKPDQAAALVNRLEKPLAVAVLARLRPSDAGAVLGRIPAGDAAELFTLLSRSGAPTR